LFDDFITAEVYGDIRNCLRQYMAAFLNGTAVGGPGTIGSDLLAIQGFWDLFNSYAQAAVEAVDGSDMSDQHTPVATYCLHWGITCSQPWSHDDAAQSLLDALFRVSKRAQEFVDAQVSTGYVPVPRDIAAAIENLFCTFYVPAADQ
jgi:hypothetical protein